jgi:hypothetical protein
MLTLAHTSITPVACSEMILNGVLQQRGAGNDYQILGLQLLSEVELTAHCFKCNCNLFRIII